MDVDPQRLSIFLALFAEKNLVTPTIEHAKKMFILITLLWPPKIYVFKEGVFFCYETHEQLRKSHRKQILFFIL